MMTAIYRADQVGSLLRPPELLAARAAFEDGRLSADGLREAEDRAILDALAMQREVGLDVFMDGEMRRFSWLSDMAEAVEGFVGHRSVLHWRGPGGGPEHTTARMVGAKLRPTRHLTSRELPFLQQHAPGPIKMTIPAPSNFMVVGYKAGVSDSAYPTRTEFAQAVAGIVRDEIRTLLDAGVPYIQLDAPFYSVWVDAEGRERMRQGGTDPDQALAEAVAADAACLEGVERAGTTLAMHVCRGNSRGRWIAEGGYEPLAEPLFGRLPIDTWLLEYDTERAGGFEPLRFVQPGATVVLGLITTKEPALESEDELRRRIDEASQYVPLERLTLSPQCGFASVAAGNDISQDDQRRKLELVVKTARAVWG
jgi:5-methyltetrahydropteroyltriglutamate--homocysteine methyltransferase